MHQFYEVLEFYWSSFLYLFYRISSTFCSHFLFKVEFRTKYATSFRGLNGRFVLIRLVNLVTRCYTWEYIFIKEGRKVFFKPIEDNSVIKVFLRSMLLSNISKQIPFFLKFLSLLIPALTLSEKPFYNFFLLMNIDSFPLRRKSYCWTHSILWHLSTFFWGVAESLILI